MTLLLSFSHGTPRKNAYFECALRIAHLRAFIPTEFVPPGTKINTPNFDKYLRSLHHILPCIYLCIRIPNYTNLARVTPRVIHARVIQHSRGLKVERPKNRFINFEVYHSVYKAMVTFSVFMVYG